MYKASWKDSFLLHEQLIDHLALCIKSSEGDSGLIKA